MFILYKETHSTECALSRAKHVRDNYGTVLLKFRDDTLRLGPYGTVRSPLCRHITVYRSSCVARSRPGISLALPLYYSK